MLSKTAKEIYDSKEFSYISFDCERYTLRRNEKTCQKYGVKEVLLYRGEKKIMCLSPEQVEQIVFNEESGQMKEYIGSLCKKPNCTHIHETAEVKQ